MDQSLEQWRPVVGYEGLYEVSDSGRVRSVDGIRWNGLRFHSFSGRILKLNGTPYKHVVLSKGGKTKTHKIHVLVAQAFLPPCPGSRGRNPDNYHIDHINDDRTDNRASNLQWLKLVDNVVTKNPRSICKRKGSTHHNAKLTEDNVRYIKRSDLSGAALARKFGVSASTIYAILKGEVWNHVN